jgi:hypothetical protein
MQTRPASLRQASEASVVDYVNPADTDRSFEPDPTSPDVALPIPPPFPMSEEYHQMRPQSGLDDRPVIPDTSFYGQDSEDDIVSSAMSSVSTLTTPPTRHANSASGHQYLDRSKHKNRPFSRSK